MLQEFVISASEAKKTISHCEKRDKTRGKILFLLFFRIRKRDNMNALITFKVL